MKKLLILLLTLAMLLPVFAQAEHTAAPGATITVSGNATVTLKADYAQVTVGVSTKAPTVEEASQKNTAAIHAVIAALTEAGVLEEDIATSNYSVNAEYDYSSMGGQRLTGYNVSNQLNVTIRDMEHRIVKDFAPQERELFHSLLLRAIENMGGSCCTPGPEEENRT